MSAYTLFANAFLAVGGFVVALFAIGAIVALGFHLYLAFEGFVAAKFREDSGCDWTDPDCGLASLKTIPEQVDVSSSFRGN